MQNSKQTNEGVGSSGRSWDWSYGNMTDTALFKGAWARAPLSSFWYYSEEYLRVRMGLKVNSLHCLLNSMWNPWERQSRWVMINQRIIMKTHDYYNYQFPMQPCSPLTHTKRATVKPHKHDHVKYTRQLTQPQISRCSIFGLIESVIQNTNYRFKLWSL